MTRALRYALLTLGRTAFYLGLYALSIVVCIVPLIAAFPLSAAVYVVGLGWVGVGLVIVGALGSAFLALLLTGNLRDWLDGLARKWWAPPPPPGPGTLSP